MFGIMAVLVIVSIVYAIIQSPYWLFFTLSSTLMATGFLLEALKQGKKKETVSDTYIIRWPVVWSIVFGGMGVAILSIGMIIGVINLFDMFFEGASFVFGIIMVITGIVATLQGFLLGEMRKTKVDGENITHIVFGRKNQFKFENIEKIILKWGSVKVLLKGRKKGFWLMDEKGSAKIERFISTAKTLGVELVSTKHPESQGI